MKNTKLVIFGMAFYNTIYGMDVCRSSPPEPGHLTLPMQSTIRSLVRN